MSRCSPESRRGGLTLIEVVIVFGLTLLLACVVVPAIQHARESARRTESKNKLRQIGLGLHNYHDNYNGFPPGGVFNSAGRGYTGWMTSLVSYLDQTPFYNYFYYDEPWNSENNAGLFLNRWESYESPYVTVTERYWEFPLSHYSANANLMAANSFTKFSMIEDRSGVFIAGELAGDFLPWGCPYNWRELGELNSDRPTYGRPSRDGCLFLFVDGSVEFVTNNVSPDILNKMKGDDLSGFKDNVLNVQRPSSFPCPANAVWLSWRYDGNGRVVVKKDRLGKVISETVEHGM
jgi:type II secretory pathway pseudopilin PulG